jgi:hypothetical protein
MSNLNFGQAIEALKENKKVARNGWNGKGMYLFMIRGRVSCEDLEFSEAEPLTDKEVEDVVKNAVNNIEGVPINLFKGVNDLEFHYMPSIAMKTALGNVVRSWNASTIDMLAEDWCIVE